MHVVSLHTRSSRVAVTAIFFLNGTAISGLYARLPTLQAELRLTDAHLGALLLATALGLLVAQPVAATIAARVGSAPVTLASALALAAVLPLPALAPTPLTLGLALAALGASNGALDVAMNAQGIAVERLSSRRVYASFHAAMSFGAVAGAAAAGASAAFGVAPALQLTAQSALFSAAALLAGRALLPARLDAARRGAARSPVLAALRPTRRGAAPSGPASARPSRALAVLGLVAFCCLLAEGAVFDWSAVYLRRELEAGEALAAAGLAAFSVTMGLGRLAADRLADRLGPARLARGGAALAGTSFALALLAATPVAAIAGFALLGAGLAAVFPLTLAAAAARSPHAPAAPAIAAVSTAGYLGLVSGPPAIGLLSGLVGLVGALALLVALCATVALLAGAVHRPA
jgi:MFS family permease